MHLIKSTLDGGARWAYQLAPTTSQLAAAVNPSHVLLGKVISIVYGSEIYLNDLFVCLTQSFKLLRFVELTAIHIKKETKVFGPYLRGRGRYSIPRNTPFHQCFFRTPKRDIL